MKISIFLIIGYTHFVLCRGQNTTNDLYPVCSVDFFRYKRALKEYTRWRANIESTPEFIVKVLDDEMPPSQKPKRIVAVNIQPQTKSVEKIIVGGVMVTIPALTSDSIPPEALKDYTRFVPPTTVATRIEGDFYLAPVRSKQPKQPPISSKDYLMPRAKYSQRDESPPAGPQFIPHIPRIADHEFAPITPVGFTRRLTVDSPTMPSFEKSYMTQHSYPVVSRTTPFEDIFPVRTKFDMEEIDNMHIFGEDNERHYNTRTTYVTKTEPEGTLSAYQNTPLVTTEIDFWSTSEKFDDYVEKKSDERDFNEPYSLFENYEDESGSKRSGKELIDTYDDEVKVQENQPKVNFAVHTDYAIKDTDNVMKETYDDTMKDSTVKDAYFTKIVDNINKTENVSNISDTPKVRVKLTDQMSNKIRKISKSTKKTTNDIPIKQLVAQKKPKELKNEPRLKSRRDCSMIQLREYSFNSPRTLPEIEAKLKQWAEDSPVAKWIDITDGNFTTMERPIYMMIVDDPSSGQVISAKQTVMIIAGIQGRDQHAVAAAMYVLYQLIERTEAHSDLLTKYRFWIIPVFNPDGYDYAMTFPHRREWVKNLRQNWDVCKGRAACHFCEVFGLRCTIQPCYGVNLDRNFEYQWIPAEELRTEHPCGALYAGKRQLSEIETNSFVQFLHVQHRPISTFIAFKEGEILGVMYPYSHTRKKRAYDHIYKQRASRAAAAAYSISGRPYVAGQTSQFLPLYAGGIEDWVDGHLGVDNTYTIMMFRPSDSYNSNSITERVIHEAYAAMDTLVLQSLEPPGPASPVTLARAKEYNSEAATVSTSVVLLTFVAVMHLCFT